MIIKNGEYIAIDSVETDNTLSGTGRPGEPLGVNGDLGIKYEGINPVIVNNEDYTIGIESEELKVQHPITFNKNTTTIGFDNSIIPDSYTKTESDNKYALKGDVPTDVYTKTETDEKFQEKLTDYNPNVWNSKQDYISDLETIRNNAALGATAVQPDAISDMLTKTEAFQTYQPKGDYALKSELPTKVSELENDSNYTTEDVVNEIEQSLLSAIDTKQDILSAGDHIDITNNIISVSGQLGKIYTGNGPIVVDNDIDQISANTIDITAGKNIEIDETEDSLIINAIVPTKVSELENDSNYTTEDVVIEIEQSLLSAINTKQDNLSNEQLSAISSVSGIKTNLETNYYTKSNTDELLDEKQNVLSAGANIEIDNDIISVTNTTFLSTDNTLILNEQDDGFQLGVNKDILDNIDTNIDSLSAAIDTKQDILIAGKNIDITDNTVSVKDTIGLFVDDTLVVKSQNEDKLLGINKNILTNVNQDEIKTDVINVSTEDDYLKIELTDENSNKIYGGIIGDHNIKKENAGKILRINADGNALELVAQSSGGLAYNIIDSSDFQHEQNVNVALNAFNDCGVIPNIVKHLNFFFEKPLEPDVMPRGMIHFELPFDTQLLDVNVFYRLNDEEYMECNYSFLNEKDTKVPIYFKPNHLYQISLTNHNAAFYDFSDNVNEKKNFIQLWYLDPNSKLLHHFPIEESEETEIKNGTPYDEIGFENKIETIDRNNIFEYSHIYDNTEGKDSIGLSNVINKIDIIPIFEHKDITDKYDTVGFDNKIETINRKDIYQYYSKSTDTYSIGNELIDCIKKEEFGYTKEYISDNCSFGNKLEKLEIETVEINGYSRS